MWYEKLDLPGGKKASLEIELTHDGSYLAVLRAEGVEVRGLGKSREKAKQALLEKLGRELAARGR